QGADPNHGHRIDRSSSRNSDGDPESRSFDFSLFALRDVVLELKSPIMQQVGHIVVSLLLDTFKVRTLAGPDCDNGRSRLAHASISSNSSAVNEPASGSSTIV